MRFRERKYFKQVLIREFPELNQVILQDVDSRYLHISKDTDFSKSSTNPLDKRLDLMAYFLATIQALKNREADFESIENTCLEIALQYSRPKNKFRRWLKKLPPKLMDSVLSGMFLKIMDKKISRKGHQDGFLAKIITDKEETYDFGYGIDILECGVCKLFNKHNAGAYTPILCKVDRITSSLAGLELIRKGTIANGAYKCDFRFRKK